MLKHPVAIRLREPGRCGAQILARISRVLVDDPAELRAPVRQRHDHERIAEQRARVGRIVGAHDQPHPRRRIAKCEQDLAEVERQPARPQAQGAAGRGRDRRCFLRVALGSAHARRCAAPPRIADHERLSFAQRPAMEAVRDRHHVAAAAQDQRAASRRCPSHRAQRAIDRGQAVRIEAEQPREEAMQRDQRPALRDQRDPADAYLDDGHELEHRAPGAVESRAVRAVDGWAVRFLEAACALGPLGHAPAVATAADRALDSLRALHIRLELSNGVDAAERRELLADTIDRALGLPEAHLPGVLPGLLAHAAELERRPFAALFTRALKAAARFGRARFLANEDEARPRHLARALEALGGEPAVIGAVRTCVDLGRWFP